MNTKSVATYQHKCEQIIYDIKYNTKKQDDFLVMCDSREDNTIVFRPITVEILHDFPMIHLLSRFRDRANRWFPAQFRVTDERTHTWVREQLLEKKDRILFLLFLRGQKKPFGHMGLNRFNYKAKTAEIDNVIRGVDSQKSKGCMYESLKLLIQWAFRTFSLSSLQLTVFSDNDKALRLYKKIGFIEKKRSPLYKMVRDSEISWVEKRQFNHRSVATHRYNIIMELQSSAIHI